MVHNLQPHVLCINIYCILNSLRLKIRFKSLKFCGIVGHPHCLGNVIGQS